MNKYKSQECIVAFIDILGSSRNMYLDSEDTLNKVHEAYDDALAMFYAVCESDVSSPKIRIFSDNIVIYRPCTDYSVDTNTFQIVLLCAMIQEQLLSHNILVRGGISKGDFFADDIMLWGNALVRAYELESSVAIYPRIIVHPDLVAEINYFAKKSDGDDFGCFLYQDHDGLVYVDCFHDFSCIKTPFQRILKYLKNNSDALEAIGDNIKVAQKLLWHRDYLVRKLKEVPAEKDDKTSQIEEPVLLSDTKPIETTTDSKV